MSVSSVFTAQDALRGQLMYEPIIRNCQRFALSVMAGLGMVKGPAAIPELVASQARSLEYFLRTLTIPGSSSPINARRNSHSSKRRHLGPTESSNVRLSGLGFDPGPNF